MYNTYRAGRVYLYKKLNIMLIKLFLLSFIIVSIAAMALSLAMLWNKQPETNEKTLTDSSSCSACGIKEIGTCSRES